MDYSDWKDDQRHRDWYGEGYFNFSLGKIGGRDLSLGPIKDVGIVLESMPGRQARYASICRACSWPWTYRAPPSSIP
ncbi:hypothetical protein MBH78_22725 [Oceanimonas sp. NS1]|nr:hypothetical protein [Oceanimonas sp. NS1]